MTTLRWIPLCLALALPPTSALAATIVTYDTRAAFQAAVSAPLVSENFDTFAAQTPFHTASLDVGDFALSLSGTPSTTRNFIDVSPFAAGPFALDIDGTPYANTFIDAVSTFLLTFDEPTVAFGADFRALDNPNQVLVAGEILVPPIDPQGLKFWGFVSDTPFTVVEFTSAGNEGFGFDNVEYAVPEPGSVFLLSVGLAAYAVRRWRHDSLTYLILTAATIVRNEPKIP